MDHHEEHIAVATHIRRNSGMGHITSTRGRVMPADYSNLEAIVSEMYEPAVRAELKQAEENMALMEGFPTVQAYRKHHAKQARKPINRIKRRISKARYALAERLYDFNEDY